MFVENEIVELQSKNLMREVVEELDLNVRYVREGFLRDWELYNDSPVKVLVDNPGEIRDTSFHVLLDTANLVILMNLDGEKMWSGHYSESVPMGDYNLSIEPNRKVTSKEKIRVDLSRFSKNDGCFFKKLERADPGKEHELRAGFLERRRTGERNCGDKRPCQAIQPERYR